MSVTKDALVDGMAKKYSMTATSIACNSVRHLPERHRVAISQTRVGTAGLRQRHHPSAGQQP
jgi:hypothetical protein